MIDIYIHRDNLIKEILEFQKMIIDLNVKLIKRFKNSKKDTIIKNTLNDKIENPFNASQNTKFQGEINNYNKTLDKALNQNSYQNKLKIITMVLMKILIFI